MDLVSIIIINYNNKTYLKRCINSIIEQDYENIEIIFIDNQSTDGSYEYMNLEYSGKNIEIIKNTINNGYAGAANQGIEISNGNYIMIINPDIIMEKDFVEKLYSHISADENIGAITGKLLKYDFERNMKLNYIDSSGIDMYKSGKGVDRGQNELDIGQYDETEQVFGVCGAAPMYSMKALKDVKIDNEYFDNDFFAYKEDVDLSWRLNLFGYKNIYYPNAVAYHGRAFGSAKKGIINFIKKRNEQSEFLKGLSYRNQIMMEWKNADNNNELFIKKIRKAIFIVYCLIFERSTLKYYSQAKVLKSKMMNKNKAIIDRRKKSNDDIKNLFK